MGHIKGMCGTLELDPTTFKMRRLRPRTRAALETITECRQSRNRRGSHWPKLAEGLAGRLRFSTSDLSFSAVSAALRRAFADRAGKRRLAADPILDPNAPLLVGTNKHTTGRRRHSSV
jgi:hypothetical protein